MLSETWDEFRHCAVRRKNLYRDLSRIMLLLSQSPLPRIGSWTLDSNGILQLSNRPLTLRLQQLENEGVSTNIDRSLTYSATDAYYLDLLSCHDSRIRHQPNSLNDESDGRAQMANLIIMRALLSHFTNRDFRHGPFLLTLTDLHQSNIFVDDDWNIKCLIDLEWACSLPVETMRPPYWLTSRPVDDLVGQHLDSFSKAHGEFTEIFEEEEKSLPSGDGVASYRTKIMSKGWKIGNFWYFQALDSPKGLYNIFRDHIQSIFAPSHNTDSDFPRIVSEYWAVGVNDIISAKLQDKEAYERMLRQKFENVPGNT
ncbi:d571664c-5b90-4b14-a3af-6e38a8324e15-CDS [Sclerotinia trifoliorum]|uniref:D571664c-5b90-4b14-a3af-6e38a8324e15-CDS n=1 Tax=Sclerotinia trifoliorum TaxID=28548 RepID=A0A8H2VW85_9HELO|nr:d571664c-5b90-4b14-a3af-6e38a8324e15-CDS [Sclerotinia trifoliorum]